MRAWKPIALVCGAVSLLSCAMPQVNISAPADNRSLESNRTVVEKPFDETWDGLIRYASQSFFGIDNFEKDSGLMTLSFGASDIRTYVDCGYYQATTGESGDLIDVFSRYGAYDLAGAMNIVVSSIDESQSEVIINARYVLAYNWPGGNHRWVFESDSVGRERMGDVYVSCRPTLEAERSIIEAIESL